MENRDGVLWDGIFYYKDLTNAVKLSHQQMNHNFEMVASLSQNMTNQVDMSAQSAAEALASQRAAALSETAASQSAGTANAARTQAQAANTAAQGAKNEVNTKAQQVSDNASQVAQDRQAVAGHAQQVSAHAQQVAADKTQVASDKQASESARNVATQKAGEANQSAIDAEYWAGQSQESAGAVTSVQGKDKTVVLERSDFDWMGSAAEATLAASVTDETVGRVLRVGDHGIGTKGGVSLGEGVNLDTYQANGFYSQSVNAWALENLNYPAQVAGTLLVLSAGTTITTQIYTAYNDGRVWTRSRYNSAWSNWQLHYSDYTLPQATQAEINAGTQTAPRLFSPKQLFEVQGLKRRIEIVESQTIQRPTDGPMLIVLFGAGGGGGARRYGTSGATPLRGADGGSTEALGVKANGGKGGAPASGTGTDGGQADNGDTSLFNRFLFVFLEVSDYILSDFDYASNLFLREEVLMGMAADTAAGGASGAMSSYLAHRGGSGGLAAFYVPDSSVLPTSIDFLIGSGGARGTGPHQGQDGGNGAALIIY